MGIQFSYTFAAKADFAKGESQKYFSQSCKKLTPCNFKTSKVKISRIYSDRGRGIFVRIQLTYAGLFVILGGKGRPSGIYKDIAFKGTIGNDV